MLPVFPTAGTLLREYHLLAIQVLVAGRPTGGRPGGELGEVFYGALLPAKVSFAPNQGERRSLGA